MRFLIALLALVASCNADITSGLLAHWRMDEGNGTTVSDASGNGRSGSFYTESAPHNTTPTWVAGKYGSALLFKITDSVEFSNFADDLPIFSVSMWYKVGNDTQAGQLQMVTKYDVGHAHDAAGWQLMNESGDITWAWGAATCYSEGGGYAFPDNNWHHVVCVVTGTTNLVQYHDGSAITQAYIHTCDWTTMSNTGAVRLGRPRDGSYYGFIGTLDDVRIYSRALTSGDVTELYNWDGSNPSRTASSLSVGTLRSK